MQPACSLQLGPCCDPSPAPGSSSVQQQQGITDSLYQLEEKQLFEKFWKGTFKAVATPRPESVIVTSITARRREMTSSETTACQTLQSDEGRVADTRVDTVDRKVCLRGKRRRHHHSRRRHRSRSFDEDVSPRPKAKKKKRKSERKRKRKRSPSYSLSPLRKKKKKKNKKSSKKSKRHRYTSKKSKHSSSSLKHKRKDERKHKKSSRIHSRRRKRYRRSESESSYCQSSAEDRHTVQSCVVHQTLGELSAVVEDHTGAQWRPATKSVCKTAPKYRSFLSTASISPPKPGSELLLHGTIGPRPPLSGQTERGPHDYDSGNDTSSPPSSKTGVSLASAADGKGIIDKCKSLTSPEKLKFADRDSVSDSGNSVTSYASLCKPFGDDHGLSAAITAGNSKREQVTVGCQVEVGRSPHTSSSCSRRRRRRMVASSRSRLRSRSFSSRSPSRSSGGSSHSGRYSRSPSLLSRSSYYSRSPSHSADVRRRCRVASLSSRGSYSRYSPDRLRSNKRKPSSRENNVKHAHKVSGKRRRRKSYSPMKKRRRDSPSHLEARRITSARKRPVPYFRPSPSSSSRSTSVSSWSSLFTRSRSPSPSPVYALVRSQSRSPSSSSSSSSSHWSYSRSSSFNSLFGTRSRSRSHSLPNGRRKKRRH